MANIAGAVQVVRETVDVVVLEAHADALDKRVHNGWRVGQDNHFWIDHMSGFPDFVLV